MPAASNDPIDVVFREFLKKTEFSYLAGWEPEKALEQVESQIAMFTQHGFVPGRVEDLKEHCRWLREELELPMTPVLR